jgi:uncharacterized protein (TIGR02466 family)
MSVESRAPQPLDAFRRRQLADAEARLRAGDSAGAAERAAALVAQVPTAAEAWHLWALALVQGGSHAEACERFLRAVELDPDNAHLLANCATALRRAGRASEAIGHWRRAVSVAPDFGQAWLDLGLTEIDCNEPAAACRSLQRAVAVSPDSARAWHGLGYAMDALGRSREAEQAFRRSLACHPDDAAVWINLGHALRRQGRPGDALDAYGRAHRLCGDTPELLDAVAGACLDDGQIEQAIATARRLTAEHPRFATGQRTLARMLWQHPHALPGDQSPLSGFAAAVAAHPEDGPLRLAYAQMLRQTGDAEAALEHVIALRRRGDHPVLMRAQADTLEALGRSAEAGPLYDALYRGDGAQEADFLNAFTRHCLRVGDWQRAEQLSAEATARNPQDQEAWAYRATAWRLLGDGREGWLCDYDRLVAPIEVPCPPGYDDLNAYLKALREALLPLHSATRQPLQQSLDHGTQTAGSLFGRAQREIDALETAFQQAAERWTADLPVDRTHPFLRHAGSAIRFSGSWSVRLGRAGHHRNHVHQHGWISSAYYVALPPSMLAGRDEAGCIAFGQPPVELGLDLPARRVVRPRPGHLVLFPSYLWHGTVPFDDARERLTVACDMVAAGRDTARPGASHAS